ncbi:MAG: EamA family transporter [Phycisphaerales bacterium]|nr:EamA family transporter [Phycisphaerales bacterium]
MKAILMAVMAGLCWGVGELLTKSALSTRQIGPMSMLLLREACAVPPALAVYLIFARGFGTENAAFWKADSAVLIKGIVGAALFAGFGGVFFYYQGLRYGEISVVKPVAFAVAPAVAFLVGMAVLGESFSWQKTLGVAMLLGGLIVITSTARKPTPVTGSALHQVSPDR